MTQEKDFIEIFPSLESWGIDTELSPTLFPKPNTMKWVRTDKIMEFCLDKAKVKEAIDKKLDNLTYKDNFEEK